MAEKYVESTVAHPIPKKHSLFRLVTDQARIDDDVLNYRYDGEGTPDSPYVVTWIPDDAGNPMNWSKGLKWTIALTVAVESFVTAFSSSAFMHPLLTSRILAQGSREASFKKSQIHARCCCVWPYRPLCQHARISAGHAANHTPANIVSKAHIPHRPVTWYSTIPAIGSTEMTQATESFTLSGLQNESTAPDDIQCSD